MGGFRPSPNFIPSNTQIGTLTSSNHQFTGSVDITGSLLINGVSITANGGGGGAVSNYTNSGDNRVITSVNSNTINGEANFTYDGTTVQVVGTSVQQKWAYDGSNDASLTVAADGDLTVAALATGATASFAAGDVHVDAAKHIKLQTDGGAVYLQRPGGTTRLVFDFSTGLVTQNVPSANPLVFRHLTNLTEIARFEGRTTEFRMSKTGSVNFRDTETGIHSPSANILEVNSKASGSTQFIVSGAFGNTDFETRSVNFSILSPSGTSIVDTTALGNNVTYTYSIEDGSFVGQEKKIFGKITFVQGQTTNSNALMITGSNIEGTSPGGGQPPMAFLSGNAGTGGMSMVWSGSKWLTVGANNFVLQ